MLFRKVMWRYGEVLLPLPPNARRIDVGTGKGPAEEVQYAPECGGAHYGEGKEKLFVWRTAQNQLELFDLHVRNQELNEGVVVNFPRHVQVLPHVALVETDRGLTLTMGTQASFHMVELADIPGTSILSDLTSSSFNKSYHIFKVPLSIISSHLALDECGTKAVLATTAKNQPSCIYW